MNDYLIQTDVDVMTEKQLAEVLGVTDRTIRNTANKLGLESTYHPLKTEGGWQNCRVFDEAEATAIKQEIQGKHNLTTRKIDSVFTELEENEAIAQALLILQRRNETLRNQYEQEKIRADKAEHTNNLLMHSLKLYTVTEIAKELGFPSAIELNKILESKGIQYKVNGTWVPSAKYSNRGFFEIKQEVHDNGFVYYDRKITQEGREFILELLEG